MPDKENPEPSQLLQTLVSSFLSRSSIEETPIESSIVWICTSSNLIASAAFFSSWTAALRVFKASVALQMSASSSDSLLSSRAIYANFFSNLTLFGCDFAVLVTRANSADNDLWNSVISGVFAILIMASSLATCAAFFSSSSVRSVLVEHNFQESVVRFYLLVGIGQLLIRLVRILGGTSVLRFFDFFFTNFHSPSASSLEG